MRLSHFVAPAVLAAALFVPAPAFAARTLGLSAAAKDFRVDAGGSGKGDVTVSNNGEDPMNVLVYIADQRVDEKGNLSFIAPGRGDVNSFTGPAGWVRIEMPKKSQAIGNIPYVHLNAGEKVTVKYNFTVPADTPSGDHNSILFFEMFSMDGAGSATTSRVSGRIGSRIKVRVTGDIIENLKISEYDADGFVFNEPFSYRALFTNDGNVDKRVDVNLTLVDGKGREAFKSVVATDAAVFANHAREFTGTHEIESSFPRKYRAVLTATYKTENGSAQEIVEQADVWMLPVWSVVAAAVLAVLAVLGVVWRIASASVRRRMRRNTRRRRGRSAEGEGALSGEPDAFGEERSRAS